MESGFWDPSADLPRRGPGNSETRNLEFAEEYPGVCTLGNMESGFWRPSADPRRGPGNSETRNLEFAISYLEEFGFPCCKVAPPPPPPRALGDRSSLPGGSPPWSTVGQPLFVNGHIMIVHVYLDTVNFGITRNLEKFCVRVQDAIVTEIRSTKNDHLCHYFPIVPSLTIAYVDSQRTQRYTRHRRMTTVSSDSGQVAQVVALVQQPVKAPTAPATADSAPVPAGLAGAAQIQSCGSGCAACPSQLRR
jgi:hypothetical protein